MGSASLRSLLASGEVRSIGGLADRSREPAWDLESLVGRLVEIDGAFACAASSAAVLTAAVRLVADAQRHREPVAWIHDRSATVFPPDVAAAGVDLEALPLVCVRNGSEALRAADSLLRSGAFGLVVIDLTVLPRVHLSMPVQVRLGGLARQHGSAIVMLFGPDRKSLHPKRRDGEGRHRSHVAMASLRVSARRERVDGADEDDVRFCCVVEALKDKRIGRPWAVSWRCSPPPGLR